jgi:hypothetical protein
MPAALCATVQAADPGGGGSTWRFTSINRSQDCHTASSSSSSTTACMTKHAMATHVHMHSLSTHVPHAYLCVVPCNSSTSRLPPRWCRRSTFWVMMGPSQPRDCNDAIASWAALGGTEANSCQPAKLRAQYLGLSCHRGGNSSSSSSIKAAVAAAAATGGWLWGPLTPEKAPTAVASSGWCMQLMQGD